MEQIPFFCLSVFSVAQFQSRLNTFKYLSACKHVKPFCPGAFFRLSLCFTQNQLGLTYCDISFTHARVFTDLSLPPIVCFLHFSTKLYIGILHTAVYIIIWLRQIKRQAVVLFLSNIHSTDLYPHYNWIRFEIICMYSTLIMNKSRFRSQQIQS